MWMGGREGGKGAGERSGRERKSGRRDTENPIFNSK